MRSRRVELRSCSGIQLDDEGVAPVHRGFRENFGVCGEIIENDEATGLQRLVKRLEAGHSQ
jgi:hypothetical protein